MYIHCIADIQTLTNNVIDIFFEFGRNKLVVLHKVEAYFEHLADEHGFFLACLLFVFVGCVNTVEGDTHCVCILVLF